MGNTDRLSNDETVCRRIPIGFYKDQLLSGEAFRPDEKRDANGLSLQRARYKPLHRIAISPARPDAKFFVAMLKVSDLAAANIRLEVDPNDATKTHVLIPELNYKSRNDKVCQEWRALLRTKAQVMNPADTPVVQRLLDSLSCWIRRMFL